MTKNNICVVTVPTSKKGTKPTRQLFEILKNTKDNVFLISGSTDNESMEDKIPNTNKVTEIKNRYEGKMSLINRVKSFLDIQYQIFKAIIKYRKQCDEFLFFIGGELLIFPHIFLKLLGKKTTFLLAGNPAKGSSLARNPFHKIINMLSYFNLFLSNRIFVYSKRMIDERKLKQFTNKVKVVKRHYISDSEIEVRDISQKKEIIGFLGEINSNKGVHNLFIAFEKLLHDHKEFLLYIGGKGDDSFVNELKNYASKNNFQDKVKFLGWISRNDIPDYFSRTKYFVLPSLTEGLPNTILEAMACGCCVISTPVGGILDVVEDNVNGFIIKDNSPNSIYNGLIRAKNSDLASISKKAHKTILDDYQFQSCVKSFESSFNSKRS